MPEKQIDKYILGAMAISAFLVALAKALSDGEKLVVKDFIIKVFVGMIGGMLFGFVACWMIGEQAYAVTAISGAGAVLGIEGVRLLAERIEKSLFHKKF